MSPKKIQSFGDIITTSRIVVCCGSGGVGKTTTAAALAVQAAHTGRRVVLITIDPAKRLADALGLDGLSNDPSRVDLACSGELWAMMLDARTTFDDVIRRESRDLEQQQAILKNPFYSNIASRLSGSQEYMAAEKLYELSHDERFDLVVVDTPPSREALDFLDAPQKLMNFLDHRVYRWLVMPARGGLRLLNFAAQPILKTIGRVIGADVLADAVNFFQAFDGIEEGFRQRCVAVQELLKSSSSTYIVVACAHNDTIVEAIYFTEQLAEANINITGVILNRLQPPFGKGSSVASLTAARKADKTGDSAVAVLHRNLAHLRSLAEAQENALKPLLERSLGAVVVRLYQRAEDVHDLEAIAELGRDLVATTTTR